MQQYYVIQTEKLVKKFGRIAALNGLDLRVKPGEIHGFLGPNGSGKSTTIRILLGLMKKTGGTALLFGQNPLKDPSALHRRLAYVPGEVNLWPNLSGGECIDLLADLGGGLDKARRTALLKRFNFDPSQKFRTYSKGNRQKVALIAALAADVELYIFDEPTAGLDPLMEATFQDCVGELKAKGKTILLSSHLLAEVEALCDRITIIRAGRTIVTGYLSDIRKLQHTQMIIKTRKPTAALIRLRGVRGFKKRLDGSVSFEVEAPHLPEIMKVIANLEPTHITSQPPKLETLFLRYYDPGRQNEETE